MRTPEAILDEAACAYLGLVPEQGVAGDAFDLSPGELSAILAAIRTAQAEALEEAAWLYAKRADDFAHGPEPEYADHRAEQAGREAEARYLARTIRALAIEQGQHSKEGG